MNEWRVFADHKIDIPTELFEIFKTKPVHKIKSNQIVYCQGEFAENFYYLKNGKVQVFVNSQDGLEKNLTIYETGSIFGEASFFDGLPRMSSAKTFSNSEIVTIKKSDIILYFQKDPSLAFNFIKLLSQKVRMLSNQIDNISFLSAEKRIAQYLLNINTYNNCSINYTHEDIGKSVGASRVTVSRALKKLSHHKWIDTKYKQIIILNKDAIFKFLQS
ncbi:Crp/Fnr family transcriptional regulator [Clostridium estertheticum]|uniref:Crp/Fnr family transcriptional regulator n=1 Tax=Clostridium estertheticum TaxID=238834 RepID=UPI001CF1EDA9|nr:Crp/Fnr family transcriptional regulator [Clostridium estertheticum]MCB2357239.1 Crp/Fnr family transcriptional regulator [Clostridium estertheticum]WAG43973.1 Crp/Fnr family transcriptional regulator [Clostridium estertheticum]